ncbi:MAG: hypothetical protein EHM13_05005 [Acidobacteria bacterium]|nr:MAG: hypothetical protein EHM13_05005 [Acidobacteriota bacterium]
MQQRRLRLGDILDDYCPRERRITNHAVVAMIDDEVRQTRCTTCDAEHEYKQGKAPTLRKKRDSVSAAYHEVLAGVAKPATPTVPEPAPPEEAAAETERHGEATPAPAPPPEKAPEVVLPAAQEQAPVPAVEAKESEADPSTEGRVHRRLIRATLPRPENHQATRPLPQFTMRQPTGRAGKFRPGPRGQRPGVGRPGTAAAGAPRGLSSARNSGQPGRGGRPDAQRGRAGQRHGKKHK